MEPKSGFRTIKKSASSGAIGERKKAKQKKKKDKKKLSLKGTESTDVPSPELDSEVPLDGDVALTDQDGQSTPVVGQVTRLPRLNSHSTLSLTTSSPPPRLVTSSTTLAPTSSSSSSRTASLGHSGGTNSAPIIRSSLASGGGAGSAGAVPASPSSALVTVPSSGNLEGVVARVADLNIKQRSSTSTTTTTSSTTSSTKTRSSKGQSSKSGSGGGKSSRTRGGGNGGGSKTSQSSKNQGGGDSNNNSNSSSSSSSATVNNESLRWERVLEDTEKERERLAVYKMNRRKRYLAAAQAKGLGWALNYNSSQLGSSTSSIAVATPLSEDSGVETATCGSPGGSKTATGMTGVKNSGASPSSVSSAAGAYIDFSSMQTLRPIPAHRGLQEAFVEC